jgi:isoquinoline 1-oxidoreductase alpha subunit
VPARAGTYARSHRFSHSAQKETSACAPGLRFTRRPHLLPLAAMALKLTINGQPHSVDADPQTPLLWVIRDYIGLTGTKFSCGIAQCGACTVHVDGQPTRSCMFPASLAVGKSITTIEGLSKDGSHPIQLAWRELDAPQCGYCQSGMIMAALALLKRIPNPTDADIDANVTNACRCSSYHRVRQAIHRAAELMKE